MNNLKKNGEFQIIYNSGRKSFGYYSLIFFKRNDDNLKRCGFVVSKKTGNAVCRNRLKRLFREYYRQKEEYIKDGYDIIFVAKKTAGEKYKELKFEDIRKDLDKVLNNAKIFK
ncbi:ribonuclease P protein component [Fusobacterium mortiferum]|jgi:ribonuclease P protein component|uniref:Ribonuclease P protein component n=2 Tax=Fusobacterium TaxID=848 RepID=A0ABS2G076_FUSMR|nr:ribonuclease P protein component [Fusobacterium mortiferum]MBM6823107.1 ribonuclease P protein component [Fusobacterium mortiferum]MBM6874794.1 ribonuclease P protein component [Fusobacterium mortiferum]MBU3842977.1 ribonuclease P protein component [Candidatus Fusobacterium pullicola]